MFELTTRHPAAEDASMQQRFLLILGMVALLTAAGPAPEDETTYFLGESRVTAPDGKYLGSMVELVKRELRPSEGKIYEHVAVIDPRYPQSKKFVAVCEVKGTTFAMTEQEKSFTGDGELTGDPWRWTAWRSTSHLASGIGTVESEDTLTEHALIVKKRFVGPDGKVRVHMAETLNRISKEMYDILDAKIVAGPPPKTP